jgi:hypothetical protein
MNTQATIDTVNAGTYLGAAHRMKGVSSRYGLSAHYVAQMVANNILRGSQHLNGVLLQVDAGEL